MASWTSPHDKIAAKCKCNGTETDCNTLYDIHQSITSSPSNASYRKVICELDAVDVEMSALLSMSEVETNFDSNLTVVVYDINGYNFSLEYTHIYHAQEIQYSDVAAITTRALRAIDASLPQEVFEMYRDYILKVIIREVSHAENVSQDTFKKVFPNCDATVKRNSEKIFQVYIGRDEENSNMHFYLRTLLDMKSQGNRDDVAYEKYVQMWYLHRYELSKSAIEDSDLQTFHEANTSSTASKPANFGDVHIGMIVTKDSIEEPELDGDIEITPSTLSAVDESAVITTVGVAPQCTSLPLSEIWGWGNPGCGIYAQQSKSSDFLGDPQLVLIPPVVNLEGVAMIACSQRHVLLLTRTGVVYSTGDNTEGALGLGDVVSRNIFEPVVFASTKETVIVKIAAASGAIGSSSMAIDDAGTLYSWGVGYSSGTGTAKPLFVPTTVSLPTIEEQPSTVVDVACGSGFTVAVLSNGQVASWGMWAHGRLGLGQPPVRHTPSGLFTRGRTKVPRYQLLPKLIPHLQHVVKVACGEAHTVALTKNGALIAWGQNSLGQVGVGCSNSGFLRDIFTPRKLEVSTKFIDICCGGFHSLAMDEHKNVWSWGARGMSCLGRLNTQITGYWASKIASLFSVTATNTKVMVPYELVPWCNRFSTPCKIDGLGNNVTQLSAGDMHSAFLCSNGQIFLCGEGSVIPPIVTHADGEPPTESSEDAPEQTPVVTFVSTPRCPSPMWMNQISTRRIKYIASGGLHMMVVADDDFISPAMTDSLRRPALPKSDISVFDDLSQASDARPGDLTDCRIIVAGRVLRAHRAVVASRSSVLRDMLLEEDPLNDEIASGPTFILLPDVLHNTARALLNYIYTGTLSYQTVRDVTLLHSLSRAAKTFKIPRLQVACDRLLQIHEAASSLPLKELMGDMEQEAKALRQSLLEMHLDVPPSTLSRDMGNLVGDPQYSDVRFVAEGRVICAHRFILQSRCDYFRAMFETGMAESVAADAAKKAVSGSVDIVVPDTFVGFLRFLIFLYTDVLPDGSDGALLEDLLSADRYQMSNMKTLVENMLLVTESNWYEILRAAILFNSARLKIEVFQFLKDHTSALAGEAWEEIKADHPEVIEELLTLQMESFPSPPSQLLIERSNETLEQKKGQQESFQMPWWALAAALLGALAYTYAIRVISLGPLVPVLNLVAFAGIIIYFVKYVLGA